MNNTEFEEYNHIPFNGLLSKTKDFDVCIVYSEETGKSTALSLFNYFNTKAQKYGKFIALSCPNATDCTEEKFNPTEVESIIAR